MTDQLQLVRDHANDKHPLLDCGECPVCQWILRQRQQSETDQ